MCVVHLVNWLLCYACVVKNEEGEKVQGGGGLIRCTGCAYRSSGVGRRKNGKVCLDINLDE